MVKSTAEISQNFVAFSEYMIFTKKIDSCLNDTRLSQGWTYLRAKLNPGPILYPRVELILGLTFSFGVRFELILGPTLSPGRTYLFTLGLKNSTTVKGKGRKKTHGRIYPWEEEARLAIANVYYGAENIYESARG